MQIEMPNQVLYDLKAKVKLDVYSRGDFKFENDFNLKLMVIKQLMYVDKGEFFLVDDSNWEEKEEFIILEPSTLST